MLNPPRKMTPSERRRVFFSAHSELVIFVVGLVLGFVFGKL